MSQCYCSTRVTCGYCDDELTKKLTKKIEDDVISTIIKGIKGDTSFKPGLYDDRDECIDAILEWLESGNWRSA